MESYVVRIYRREWPKGTMAGTVEEVGSGKRVAFQDSNGLIEALSGGRRRKRRSSATSTTKACA